jgi:hypothetical protein
MVIMASPRADSISSPKAATKAGKTFPSSKKPAVGSPNLTPPPKYEMQEDWPVDGAIDLGLVSAAPPASRPCTTPPSQVPPTPRGSVLL